MRRSAPSGTPKAPFGPGILLALVLFAQPLLSRPPDWIPLADAGSQWCGNRDAVVLLNSVQMRFLPPDGSTVRIVGRSAYKANRAPGIASLRLTFPYDPGTFHIKSSRVWVVSPDGEQKAKYDLSDFTDVVAKYDKYEWTQERDLVFLPNGKIDAGDVMAWEIRFDVDVPVPYWPIAFPPGLPCLKARCEAIPPPGGRLATWSTFPLPGSPTEGREPGSLAWSMDKLAPFPDEVPTSFLFNVKGVLVHCIPAGDSAGAPSWRAVSAEASRLLDPAVRDDAAIREEASALVAGNSGRWQRIRAITEFVQRDVDYLEIILDKTALAGWRPHAAPEVLHNRSGDCKDKAALLIALLEAVGEHGRFVAVRPGNPKAVDENFPSLAAFDHMIVAIPADSSVPGDWPMVQIGPADREVIFDPTDPVTPLGVLSESDQAGFGLLVDKAAGTLFRLPVATPSANRLVRRVEAELDGRGDLKARFDDVRIGQAGAASYLFFRYQKSGEQSGDLVEHIVRDAIPVVSGIRWTDEWNPSAARHGMHLEFEAPGYGRSEGAGLLLFSPDILPFTYQFTPWKEPLDGVVWFPSDSSRIDARIAFPPGYEVDELPDPWKQQGATSSAEISFRVDGNAVVVSSHLERQAGFYGQADYEALRSMYDGLRDAARGPVVLRKASAGGP